MESPRLLELGRRVLEHLDRLAQVVDARLPLGCAQNSERSAERTGDAPGTCNLELLGSQRLRLRQTVEAIEYLGHERPPWMGGGVVQAPDLIAHGLGGHEGVIEPPLGHQHLDLGAAPHLAARWPASTGSLVMSSICLAATTSPRSTRICAMKAAGTWSTRLPAPQSIPCSFAEANRSQASSRRPQSISV